MVVIYTIFELFGSECFRKLDSIETKKAEPLPNGKFEELKESVHQICFPSNRC